MPLPIAFIRPLAAACTLLMAHAAGAASPSSQVSRHLTCHITYGGENRAVVAHPTIDPYAVPTVTIGSFFRFRAVLQSTPRDLAGIHLYVYADRDEAPVLIHQTSFPYPPQRQKNGGFTGYQRVYEPMRDGELEYWCEMSGSKK